MCSLRLVLVAALSLALGATAAALITWAVMRDTTASDDPAELRNKEWWETAVFYQIYPRSFKDSDGDGIGDLPGITSQLEHFVESGVVAIWMSPIFVSPMVDFGYDISDFYDIQPEYGTMDDFDEFIDRAHQLGLKVLLDFVANHASTQSQYFQLSVQRAPGYEDFFVWDDGIVDPNNANNRLPPSNWVSQFGGSAWEWNEQRQQFYLHQFAVEQADFNYRNPAVREEMINILRFWLEKGADGFRLDALPYMFESEKNASGLYPDDPLSNLNYYQPGDLGYTIPIHTKDHIDLYEVVYEWRTFIDEWSQENSIEPRIILSEGYANVSMTMLYYGDGNGRQGSHYPFNFDFITDVDYKSTAKDFVYVILRWLTYIPYGNVPNWLFGNHDNNRMPTRFREDMVDGLNSLNLMLPGVATTYQGEEIGMKDGYVSWEDTVDVQACNMGSPEDYLLWSRDPARTPYHWDDSTSAGFSTSEDTWLPVALDYTEINLAAQRQAARSHYKVYQALTALRNEETMKRGGYDIRALSDGTLALVRTLSGHDTLTLIFNVGETADTVNLDRVPHLSSTLRVYISSINSSRLPGDIISRGELELAGGEALVLRSAAI